MAEIKCDVMYDVARAVAEMFHASVKGCPSVSRGLL